MAVAGSGFSDTGETCDFFGARGATSRHRWSSSAFIALLCLLVQGCGNSENKVVAKSEAGATSSTTYAKADIMLSRTSRTADAADLGPSASFSDRYGAVFNFATDAAPVRSTVSAASMPSVVNDRTARASTGSYKLASLSPELPYASLSPVKQAQTRLIGFENSAFPYFGSNPRSGGGGYASGRYSDNRVLVHVPAEFDARKPAVIIVYFHGHGATLERDVRDRQLLPKQISESGVNAVLVAPQLAYDAADSSAGKFWERGGFKRFMAEAAENLARMYGDPRSAEAFSKMPVVIVAYSGGFLTAASCLQVGGLGSRVRGVVLLDALYGEFDKFSSWIANNRSAFFVSAYTPHNKRRDDDLARILKDKGIPIVHELNGPLRPGTVAFLSTEGLSHRDFVTLAWTDHPVKDVLARLARR
ncbi:MAG: alpha/beta hydrolase [Proteobacteria bacterium]|nr:MAG: alpha/beta hydrolase [Pseudomonadota bacterium]